MGRGASQKKAGGLGSNSGREGQIRAKYNDIYKHVYIYTYAIMKPISLYTNFEINILVISATGIISIPYLNNFLLN